METVTVVRRWDGVVYTNRMKQCKQGEGVSTNTGWRPCRLEKGDTLATDSCSKYCGIKLAFYE